VKIEVNKIMNPAFLVMPRYEPYEYERKKEKEYR
jgi:hypothetical protein